MSQVNRTNWIGAFLLLCLVALQSVQAADAGDEYRLLPRVSEFYRVSVRTDYAPRAIHLPSQFRGHVSVEGPLSEIFYENTDENNAASHLQMRRHAEMLTKKLGGEIVFAGNSFEYPATVTLRFPKKGRTVWANFNTGNGESIYVYKLSVAETNELWDKRTSLDELGQ